MRDISYYIFAMLPYMILPIPLIFLIRCATIKFIYPQNIRTTLFHEVGIIIYVAFIIGLFSQTVISHLHTINSFEIQSEINVIPGKIIYDSIRLWRDGNSLYFVISLLGNIVMFIPFGFFTPLLWRDKSVNDSLLAGFFASLSVEICQLPLAYRTSDIDDLILNTFGAFMGYVIYSGIKCVLPEFTEKFCVEKFYY